ncbi:MAG: ABC transporter ATP-binding protein [Elusimicrobia bacterium]|nr:ABC transporter ATP-binding protein [Elusimicrobiota bacterium]
MDKKTEIPSAAAAEAANVSGARTAVELAGLCKTYSLLFGSKVDALSDVTATLYWNEVVGIAGPNGAGKSTLLSILLGFLGPTGGTALIRGMAPREYVQREGIAYLPELIRIPPKWTVETALRRLGALGSMPRAAMGPRVETVIAELGLGEYRGAPAGRLSKGTLQRLGIAQTLMADSDLMIFDEPSNGLDPVWIPRFRELVRKLRRPGRLILIASHNLDELERLTDRVAILDRGRLQRVVRSGAVVPSASFRLKLGAPCAALKEIFPEAVSVEGRENEYRLEGDAGALNLGLAKLLAAGAVVSAFQPDQSGLERAFRSSVKKPV